MKDLGIDFGILIAYLVPGGLGLWGISFWYPDLQDLIRQANSKDGGGAAVIGLTFLALVLGMLLSVFRAGTIDRSFKRDLRSLPFSRFSSLSHPPVGRVNPLFSKYTTKEKLAAYQEAKASDKRPYQFYGNTILSLLLFAFGHFYGVYTTTGLALEHVALIIGLAAACFGLFIAARTSHARFAASVEALNADDSPERGDC